MSRITLLRTKRTLVIRSIFHFFKAGLQTAASVPFMCDEPADFKAFRLGLFGLDKLMNIDRTVQNLEAALKNL